MPRDIASALRLAGCHGVLGMSGEFILVSGVWVRAGQFCLDEAEGVVRTDLTGARLGQMALQRQSPPPDACTPGSEPHGGAVPVGPPASLPVWLFITALEERKGRPFALKFCFQAIPNVPRPPTLQTEVDSGLGVRLGEANVSGPARTPAR